MGVNSLRTAHNQSRWSEFHGRVEGKGFLPLRGRALVRKLPDAYEGALWTPDDDPHDRKIHRGEVLVMGAPARTTAGAEVQPEYAVGDTVLFVYGLATEINRTLHKFCNWEGELVVLGQEEIQAVLEDTIVCFDDDPPCKGCVDDYEARTKP